ncbi:MAG TPA: hypothetical protein VH138_18820 [Vicinamibacterales bacterium]|nr:hypothetical protein [Vicinamibacterales bacterium]
MIRRVDSRFFITDDRRLILSNVGWAPAYWRSWWLAVGIGVWLAAYLAVGRWVRERYPDADGFADQRELRSAIDRANPRTVGSDVLSAVFGLLSALIGLTDHKPRSPFVLLLLLTLLHFTGAFRRWQRASEVDSQAN